MRILCLLNILIGMGHDFEQLCDDTGSTALVCRRCDKIEDVRLYERGAFRSDSPPLPHEIVLSPLVARYVPNRKVDSVHHAIHHLCS